MNARILLSTIAVAAFAAITINASASEASLTPRAAGSQIKAVPGITVAQPAPAIQSVTPRVLDNQNQKVASGANNVNPAMECNKMVASPKVIQACAANPAGMSGCCGTAMADSAAH